jgi:D-xylose transport system substrate-binding protein
VRTLARSLVLAAAALSLAVAAACGGDDNGGSSSGDTGGGGGGGKSGTVALLLPENQTARYEAHDRPEFEANLKKLCPDCKILYSNAVQDATKQQAQADAALTQGAKVLVLDPVDGKAAASIAAKAQQQGVKIVSYDRLTSGPIDAYVSFDNERVGRLQGEALLKALGANAASSTIVMINGSPDDANAAQFKKGAHSALDGKVKIGAEYDTPGWTPAKAQQEMDQAITKLGKATIKGVYAANDGTAGGAIAAMKGAGFNPIPPTTGQDAELAGIQRVIAGDQYMTVYKATKLETQAAAQAAYDLLQGKQPSNLTEKVNNGTKDVPSQLLTPVAVTKANIEDTVVKDRYWTVQQICTAQFQQACQAAGLT